MRSSGLKLQSLGQSLNPGILAIFLRYCSGHLFRDPSY